MKRWMRVALLVLLAVFAAATVSPSQANASSTTDIVIYSAAGVGVAIVVVLVATYFTRDEDQLFMTESPLGEDAVGHTDSAIHFGPKCRKPDGTTALLCW